MKEEQKHTSGILPGQVTISKEEYDQLQADSKLLDASMSVGVDNWEEEWIQLLKYWKRK